MTIRDPRGQGAGEVVGAGTGAVTGAGTGVVGTGGGGVSLLPRTPQPWRPPAAATYTLPPALQHLLQHLGGTSHTYHPFRRKNSLRGSNSSDNVQVGEDVPPSLLLLCRNTLLNTFGLRRLRRALIRAGAPRVLVRLISTLTAAECQSEGTAPLLDVFAQPFFHRAVTWRITCSLDHQPYLTTIATYTTLPWEYSWFWVEHPHIMMVWGVVLDAEPGNTFYLMDTPIATLDQIQRRLTACGCSVPEELVWCVVYQVSSALLYMLTRGLNYSPLALDNVFLLTDRLVLENMLSRKYRMTQCSCELLRGRIRYFNSIPSGPNELCFLHSIGHLIFALITCHLRSQPEACNSAPCSPINTLRSIKHLYSPELIRVLSCCLPGGITAAWSCLGGGAGGRVAERTQQWETTWDETLGQSQHEWPLADDEGYEIHDAVMADIWYPEHYRNTYDYKSSNSSGCSPKKRRRSEMSKSMTEEEIMSSSFSELLFKKPCNRKVLKNECCPNEIAKPLPITCNDPSTVSLKEVVLIAAHEIEYHHRCRSMKEAVSSSPHRLIQHVMTVQKKYLSERRDTPGPGSTTLKT